MRASATATATALYLRIQFRCLPIHLQLARGTGKRKW
jgi:hypothetical protein